MGQLDSCADRYGVGLSTVQQVSGYKRKQIRKPNADLPSLGLPCSIKETSEFRPKLEEHAETLEKQLTKPLLITSFLCPYPFILIAITSTFPGNRKP